MSRIVRAGLIQASNVLGADKPLEKIKKAMIDKHLKLIPHMQLADTPGRHEPGTGEINYGFLLSHIDKVGYQGWIGCEYKPAAKTTDGLGWAQPYLK